MDWYYRFDFRKPSGKRTKKTISPRKTKPKPWYSRYYIKSINAKKQTLTQRESSFLKIEFETFCDGIQCCDDYFEEWEDYFEEWEDDISMSSYGSYW